MQSSSGFCRTCKNMKNETNCKMPRLNNTTRQIKTKCRQARMEIENDWLCHLKLHSLVHSPVYFHLSFYFCCHFGKSQLLFYYCLPFCFYSSWWWPVQVFLVCCQVWLYVPWDNTVSLLRFLFFPPAQISISHPFHLLFIPNLCHLISVLYPCT